MNQNPTGRMIQVVDLSEMPMQLGQRLRLRPGGTTGKARAVFVGMEPQSYLMLRLGHESGLAAEVLPHLTPGNEVRLVYGDQGTIKGFLCHIIAFQPSPFRHLFVTYPHQGECYTLRRHDRFRCHLPAVMNAAGQELRGMVADLSKGGCAVCVERPEDVDDPGLDREQPVELNFCLLSDEHWNQVSCVIRNSRILRDKLALGLSFDGLDQATQIRVQAFLDYLSRHYPADENARR